MEGWEERDDKQYKTQNEYAGQGGSQYNNQGGQSYNKNNYQGGGGKSYQGGGGGRKFPPKDEGPGRLYKTYVGAGNRECPDHILNKMKELAKYLASKDFTLRTGGTDGPDAAFESTGVPMELYLPWRGFNGKESKFTFQTPQAEDIAKMFHSGWDKLKDNIKPFLTKHPRMLLGQNLKSHAMFVICWSEDGAERSVERTVKTGNIGHLISIANSVNIPVFNLARPDAERRIQLLIEGLEYEQKQ